ncbi:hypothetical protein Tco_1509824 [Tanacetum coccineum]
MYYQVFRGDGSSKNYKILSEMLEDFDRMDVEQLFRLVKERYSSTAPEGYDLMLWGDLHTLFEPDKDDEIWRDQHEYNLLSWRLCDFCGIHILLMDNGLAIHMLTEKKYPLSQEMLSKMLSKRENVLPAMLLVATTNPSAGQEHPDVAQSQPSSSIIPVPSTSLPPVQSPPPITTPIPASTPTPIPETDPEPMEHTFKEPSHTHQHFSPYRSMPKER